MQYELALLCDDVALFIYNISPSVHWSANLVNELPFLILDDQVVPILISLELTQYLLQVKLRLVQVDLHILIAFPFSHPCIIVHNLLQALSFQSLPDYLSIDLREQFPCLVQRLRVAIVIFFSFGDAPVPNLILSALVINHVLSVLGQVVQS